MNIIAQKQQILILLAQLHNCQNIFEIGTHIGITAGALAENTSAKIYTLDIMVRNQLLGNKVTQLFGDSKKFDYTPYLNKMDMVFVDGDHTYDYVMKDTEIALKLLKGGKGLIVWDDYDTKSGVIADVIKALNEIDKKYPLVYINGASIVYLLLK